MLKRYRRLFYEWRSWRFVMFKMTAVGVGIAAIAIVWGWQRGTAAGIVATLVGPVSGGVLVVGSARVRVFALVRTSTEFRARRAAALAADESGTPEMG